MNETTPTNNQVHGIEREASKLQGELETLMKQIRELTNSNLPVDKTARQMVEISEQLQRIKQNMGQLSDQSSEILNKIDKNVKANPYLYIIGAAAVGLILGKVWRS